MAAATPAGAPNSTEAKVDLMNIEWRFQEWLMGMGGLNPDNVLDYFALSPFWDPECNNAVLRMQTQFNNLGEMKQRLSEMTGVEFALVHERHPTLFIIQKQRRRNPQEVKPLAIYYVLHGNIFQCPDLQTLLANRVLGSLHHVVSAFNEARTMAEFHPSTGYSWKSPQAAIANQTGGTGIITPALTAPTTATPGASGVNQAKAESQEFRIAMDRAIKNADIIMQQQQSMKQMGGAASVASAAASAAAASSAKIKQEAGSGATGAGTAGGSGTPTSRSAPKTATKRRKKSEEASTAAASMGINTSASGTTPQQGRPPNSAGGGNQVGNNMPTTPSSATPVKRRKKTKPPMESK